MTKVERFERIGDAAEAMLDYVENKHTQQCDSTLTVPHASYVDPDRWQREIDLVFKKVPLMLAFTAEMPKPGDYKAMEAVGMPILITRDKQGEVHAFLNVCSHRGAPVAEEGHGNCPRFTCPYHAWTFGLDGKLLAVSEKHLFGEVDKHQRGLRALPCEERSGMIFVCLDPDASMDLDDFYQGFLGEYDDLEFGQWNYLGSRTIYGANWKIAFDGYLEGYHFSALHPETVFPRTPSNRMHYAFFGPHMRIGFPHHAIGDQLKPIAREEWGHQENNGFDFARIFFPNASCFIAPEVTQFAQLFPGPTPDKNRTVLNYLRREPYKDDADREATEAALNFFRDVTYEEDYIIGEKVQKGLESGAHKDVIFGKNEVGNQHFHRWLDWYLADDPTETKPVS